MPPRERLAFTPVNADDSGGRRGGRVGAAQHGAIDSMAISDVEENSDAEDSPLYVAETEIRHLKKTIGALRDELEAVEYGKETDVQAAVAERADELVQIKATAGALREELEQMRFENSANVQ